MSDLAINPLSVTAGRFPAAAEQAQPQPAETKTAAPKTDVIDLSKPPDPEQVERLRNAGILGYGSVSATKHITTEPLSGNTSVTHFTVDWQAEYFDLVHETTVRTSSTGIGVFTSGDSAYAGTTTQLTCSWDNSSWTQTTLCESGFTLNAGGLSSWYIPPQLNENGVWSLAQYGPAPKTTISGYHSVLTTTRSDGGQTQVSRVETASFQVETVIPGGQRPAGALDVGDVLLRRIPRELLDRIDQCAARPQRPLDLRPLDLWA